MRGPVSPRFSLWSLANFARGTNDPALYCWLLLLGSGALCRATALTQRAHVLAFAVAPANRHARWSHFRIIFIVHLESRSMFPSKLVIKLLIYEIHSWVVRE